MRVDAHGFPLRLCLKNPQGNDTLDFDWGEALKAVRRKIYKNGGQVCVECVSAGTLLWFLRAFELGIAINECLSYP